MEVPAQARFFAGLKMTPPAKKIAWPHDPGRAPGDLTDLAASVRLVHTFEDHHCAKQDESMSIELRLPELGENIKSGDVVTVLVREGDVISRETTA